MRVQTKDGRFAGRETAIYRYCQRTGGTPQDYYKWATLCGQTGYRNNINKKVCRRFKVASVEKLKYRDVLEVPEDLELGELNDFILHNCQNPIEMAACYLEIRNTYKDYEDKNDFMQANLSPFPKASFLRWSDKNLIGQVSPSWFDAKGIALDVQAEILSGAYFSDFSIQEIVDFVLEHRKGKYVNAQKLLIAEYRKRVEELCGVAVKEHYIEYLAGLVDNGKLIMDNEELPF